MGLNWEITKILRIFCIKIENFNWKHSKIAIRIIWSNWDVYLQNFLWYTVEDVSSWEHKLLHTYCGLARFIYTYICMYMYNVYGGVFVHMYRVTRGPWNFLRPHMHVQFFFFAKLQRVQCACTSHHAFHCTSLSTCCFVFTVLFFEIEAAICSAWNFFQENTGGFGFGRKGLLKVVIF